MKKQPIKVNAILNVSELAATEEGVFLNEEQVHTIDARVDELENSVTSLTTERDNAVTAQQTAEQNLTAEQAKVTERDATIAAQATQIANLKKGAGATTVEVVTEVDNNAGGDDNKDEFLTNMASAKELYDIVK